MPQQPGCGGKQIFHEPIIKMWKRSREGTFLPERQTKTWMQVMKRGSDYIDKFR